MLTKVLISVKTYPTLSIKYNELVCTAGFLEDGTWIRIYPLPFRALKNERQYKKWQWVELDLVRNSSDNRPESHKVLNFESLKLIKQLDTKQNWHERKLVVDKGDIYEDLAVLINKANTENLLSLATFKPAKIIDFVIEKASREWDAKKIEILKVKSQQLSLLQTQEEIKKEFALVKKLPYKFSYKFEDVNGKQSTLMIEDWEIGALYWNCLRQCGGNEKQAVEQVREKYFTRFTQEHDILLFLGTTLRFHGWANNPFIIIGVFYPRKNC